MADSKPEWITDYLWGILIYVKENSKNERAREYSEALGKLLTDPILKSTWKRINAAVGSVDYNFRENAASQIIGGICNPLALYSHTGTASLPVEKTKIRKQRGKAQTHLHQASQYLDKAVDEIRKAVNASSYLPDEARGLEGMIREIFEYYSDVMEWGAAWDAPFFDTSVFLTEIARRLASDDDPWADVPGMQSNKSTWRDWLAEAVANLDQASRIYGADFSLRESDWAKLAKVLIPHCKPSRDSVHAALGKIHTRYHFWTKIRQNNP